MESLLPLLSLLSAFLALSGLNTQASLRHHAAKASPPTANMSETAPPHQGPATETPSSHPEPSKEELSSLKQEQETVRALVEKLASEVGTVKEVTHHDQSEYVASRELLAKLQEKVAGLELQVKWLEEEQRKSNQRNLDQEKILSTTREVVDKLRGISFATNPLLYIRAFRSRL